MQQAKTVLLMGELLNRKHRAEQKLPKYLGKKRKLGPKLIGAGPESDTTNEQS